MSERFNDILAWSMAMKRYYNYRSKVCSKETQGYYSKMSEIYSLMPNILARFEKDFKGGKDVFECELKEERGNDD